MLRDDKTDLIIGKIYKNFSWRFTPTGCQNIPVYTTNLHTYPARLTSSNGEAGVKDALRDGTQARDGLHQAEFVPPQSTSRQLFHPLYYKKKYIE